MEIRRCFLFFPRKYIYNSSQTAFTKGQLRRLSSVQTQSVNGNRSSIRKPALNIVTLCFTLYPVTSSRAKTKQLTAPSPVAASDYVLGARAQTVSCIFKIDIPDVNTKLHNDAANTLKSVAGLRAALDTLYDSSGHLVPVLHCLLLGNLCLLIEQNILGVAFETAPVLCNSHFAQRSSILHLANFRLKAFLFGASLTWMIQ